MRVAIVQESVDPRRGGAETSVREMALELGRLGVEVTLVTSAGSEVPAAEPATGPGEAVRTHGVPTEAKSKLRRTVMFVHGADQYCRDNRFDVVHAVTPCPCADVYQPRGGTYVETIRRTLARSRHPLWNAVKAMLRRFNLRQRFLLKLEREMLTRADPPCVACVSDYVRRQVLQAYPGVGPRATVVFNGVSLEPLRDEQAGAARRRWRAHAGLTSDAPTQAPIVLFVAHNFRLKGLPELLNALALPQTVAGNAGQALRGTAHLIVAGRGRPEACERRARRLGIAARVHFVGAAPVNELLAAADVLCHPTWYDPCSRVVLEAIVAGVSVVTTRWNGAAEILQPGVNGWIVDEPDDHHCLAGALEAALATVHVRATLGSPGDIRNPMPTMRRHVQALLDLYAQVCRRKDEARR